MHCLGELSLRSCSSSCGRRARALWDTGTRTQGSTWVQVHMPSPPNEPRSAQRGVCIPVIPWLTCMPRMWSEVKAEEICSYVCSERLYLHHQGTVAGLLWVPTTRGFLPHGTSLYQGQEPQGHSEAGKVEVWELDSRGGVEEEAVGAWPSRAGPVLQHSLDLLASRPCLGCTLLRLQAGVCKQFWPERWHFSLVCRCCRCCWP